VECQAERPTGQARRGLFTSPRCGIRGWVLLARMPDLLQGTATQSEFLVSKGEREPEEGPSRHAAIALARLVRDANLGARTWRAWQGRDAHSSSAFPVRLPSESHGKLTFRRPVLHFALHSAPFPRRQRIGVSP
jgi:hypothetical protein